MMTDLFLSFLEISLSTSLMILLLMLLVPFLNKRYATKWNYWIWILIALRLLIPYSGTNGAPDAALSSQRKTQTELEAKEAHSPEPTIAPRGVILEVPAQMTAPILAQSEKTSSGITVLDIVAYIWVAGSLAFLSIHLISYICYKRQVVKKGTIVKDTCIMHPLLELKRELHIKGTVRIIKYPEASSPMMIGFLKPTLILPDEQSDLSGRARPDQTDMRYSSKELFFVLKHELVHLKRRDVYVKLLFVVVNAIHWFNPLIWMMRKEAEIDMELSCDEGVTQGANYATRKAYTETLLSTLHRQCNKKNPLTTQFYGGKKIMKKRFQNILLKTRKKNGAILLIASAVLTVSLGALVGCSIEKESLKDISRQEENSSSFKEMALNLSDENTANAEASDNQLLSFDNSDGEAIADNTKTLTIMKEGEAVKKQATLVSNEIVNHRYSFYLPDGEWQKEEADMWQAVENENVRLWVSYFEMDYPIEQILAEDGYKQENGELVKEEEGIRYKTTLHGNGDDVWCVSYCYPLEAEEGWGSELPVIADTFVIIVSVDIMNGYISAFDSDSVTVDRQIWATIGSEYWRPEYNEDAGFEVVDAEGEDITYPLHKNCTFFIRQNHYDPTVELTRDEFANYLTEMEYPVLWILELENGQIKNIMEQYIP